MSEYVDNIQLMDEIGTSEQKQQIPDFTPIIEMSGEIPSTTFTDSQKTESDINQDSVSYSAPQKVIVRTYRLRK